METVDVLKYKTAYFAGYAKLPSVLSASTVYSQLTLGLQINLSTHRVEDVTCTLLTPGSRQMVRSYFLDKHVLDDADQIVEEIDIRHQGNAAKSIIKAYADIRKKYVEFCEKYHVPMQDSGQ